jgi:hypothetical protein
MPIIRITRRNDKLHTVFCTGRAVVDLRKCMHYSAAVRFPTVPNRKRNFTHILFSLLSAIIKIPEPPSRNLEKKATTTITLNLD